MTEEHIPLPAATFAAALRDASEPVPDPREGVIEELAAALDDIYSGWRYIRQNYGDLPGVGWNRCAESSGKALARAAPLLFRATPGPEPRDALLAEALAVLKDSDFALKSAETVISRGRQGSYATEAQIADASNFEYRWRERVRAVLAKAEELK